jgi:hypothetical protein
MSPGATPTTPRRGRWALDAILGGAVWLLVALKGGDIAYEFAVAFTVNPLLFATGRWARSKGVPERTAAEAYISRAWRWRRSRHTTGAASKREG